LTSGLQPATGSSHSLKDHLGDLYGARELLWMWTLREIRIRYKQSALGVAWAILQPVALTLVFTVIFSYLARVPSDGAPYPIFAYTALLPWTLLSTSIGFAVPSLINNTNLVTKIYFPKEILPLGAIGAALLDFLVATLVFVGLMILYEIPLNLHLLWLPLLIVIQIALIAGVSLVAAAINVFYRDVRFLVPLSLQIWMYASPIIYPVSLVPEKVRALYMLNPMAGLINSYRRVVLDGMDPVLSELLLAAAVSIAICAFGYGYFKKVEPEFADII
jgi:lipopolysaccharide transport system permease protein